MSKADLRPRELLEALSPRVRLDAPVIGGWELCDCYRLDEVTPVRLELRRVGRRDAGRIVIDVTADPSGAAEPRPCASAREWGFSYRPCSAPQDAMEACRVIADALRASSEGITSTRCLDGGVDEVRLLPVEPSTDPDWALLHRDARYYAMLYGATPTATTVSVNGQAAPGVSMHYPAPASGRLANAAAVEPASPRVARRRTMRRYFGSLGCAFEEDGTPRTVPTPTTFAAALAAQGRGSAIRPQMVQGRGIALSAIRWASYVRRGVLPVSVAPPWAVRWHQISRGTPLFAHLPCDVGMLAHDMGLHVLGLHAMPQVAWDELLALAVERADAGRLLGPRGSLGRLSRFFEGPVTAHCWQAWAEAVEPEDFPSTFEEHFTELAEVLRGL